MEPAVGRKYARFEVLKEEVNGDGLRRYFVWEEADAK
jgi:hypothetical protein